MGLFDKGWGKTDEFARGLLTPHLAAGEELIGALHAVQKTRFSTRPWFIGVTPQRLIMIPVDRRNQPTEDPTTIRREDVRRSSIDGFGGGLKHFLKTDLGDIRFDTDEHSWTLMILGGGMDKLVTGQEQTDAKMALLEFLESAKATS